MLERHERAICTRTRTQKCTHVRMYAHAHMRYARTYAHMHTHLYTRPLAHKHARMLIRKHVSTHALLHGWLHACMHTCTHACTRRHARTRTARPGGLHNDLCADLEHHQIGDKVDPHACMRTHAHMHTCIVAIACTHSNVGCRQVIKPTQDFRTKLRCLRQVVSLPENAVPPAVGARLVKYAQTHTQKRT